ncbi:hypothetical protein TIFTF001_017187 [Ficus carica]|uniref:Uncharacterized protein n=1 Tax=Ficus carica TaxID=3494 RepID=A0AA88D812_FICCA|nr:hypothetical protein TIFTF001_017187 [Ficus carica]
MKVTVNNAGRGLWHQMNYDRPTTMRDAGDSVGNPISAFYPTQHFDSGTFDIYFLHTSSKVKLKFLDTVFATFGNIDAVGFSDSEAYTFTEGNCS